MGRIERIAAAIAAILAREGVDRLLLEEELRLTVREAATRLKVGKTALYEALRAVPA